ncbi:MAG: carbamoyltransferase HypF [Pirellulaceae bacterium]
MSDASSVRRLAISVQGIVQGVGFRPFVYNLAQGSGLGGWVANESDAVRIEIQGPAAAVSAFVESLRAACPPAAQVEQVDVVEMPLVADGPTTPAAFVIRPSGTSASPRPTIPADLATCSACRAEIAEPTERRFRYPFTNCTNCGPRWSILTGLPYDRSRTSMDVFEMCEACQAQYAHPEDRRFHAQPIACPTCGPQLRLLHSSGRELQRGDLALAEAVGAILAGQVLALKGIGGFQLIVDATNEQAVQNLRQRKRRPAKPLAVMMSDLDAVECHCHVSATERSALLSPAAPIVLLDRRSDDFEPQIASSVAPGNPLLGVMLPYTPLHHLLTDAVRRPLVCTSGNRAEEPMAIGTQDALQRLGDIADLLLTHNRQIVRPVDDSVAREEDGHLQVLRRARGFAPLPISLDRAVPTILAVGGHLKNTVALSLGRDVILSPHIGDLDNTLSTEAHRRAIRDLVGFFQTTPDIVACDLHPDYGSTRQAERLAQEWSVPLIRVQHHVAHVLSAIAERQLAGPVLGLSWDGTGYGLDATVWGGEAIVVDGPLWTRVGHLRTFPLLGGERVAREPRRAALGMLHEMQSERCLELGRRWFSEQELALLESALERGHVFPRSSSMGRLFDSVAVLCRLPDRVSFEGEAAMRLEFVADPQEMASYPLPWTDTAPAIADWQPLLEAVLHDLAGGCSPGTIAGRFHNTLADLALGLASRIGCGKIVLTGGCFQNRLLTRRVRMRLLAAGFEVYTQRRVPPGDGGIALGQILGAALQVGA